MSAYDTATQEGTDAELTDFDGRPDDCDCWDADAELPCWPCYRTVSSNRTRAAGAAF